MRVVLDAANQVYLFWTGGFAARKKADRAKQLVMDDKIDEAVGILRTLEKDHNNSNSIKGITAVVDEVIDEKIAEIRALIKLNTPEAFLRANGIIQGGFGYLTEEPYRSSYEDILTYYQSHSVKSL